MKKIPALFLVSGLFFQLFSATAVALSYYPGTITCTSQYGYTTCQCPDGTIVYGTSHCPNAVTCWDGSYATTQSACPANIPTCMDPIYGNITIQTASVCKCPDGTYRMSTGGYAYCQQPTYVTCWDGSLAANYSTCPAYKYCPGDSTTKRPLSYVCAIPNCIEPVPGMVYPAVNIPCKCPDGRIIGSNNGYAQCYIPVTCWDGSTAYNQNSCPAYKYCPGDSVTKRALSYACPVQTQVCWNGQVISIYQQCPVQPACTYYQYWNGYSCVNMYDNIYNPYQPRTDWYTPYAPYQQPQTNWYNPYQYNNWNNWGTTWGYGYQYSW